MKLNFQWKNDQQYHQYCLICHAEKIERIVKNEKTFYFCTSCRSLQERSIVIDPGIVWWVDESGEYWHESVGIFIRNPVGEFLFFERNIYPFVLTIPSGHVDKNEESIVSALRELEEETGLKYKRSSLKKVSTDKIMGDACRRGSDAHLWHAFLLELGEGVNVQINDEGLSPIWLTLQEAVKKDISYPVRFVIDRKRYELS